MTRRFTDDDDSILKDGERLIVPMFMKDGSPNPALSPIQRAIAATHDAMTFDAGMHRPGYRYPSSTAAMSDAAAKRNTAYNDYERDRTDAWKSKAPPAGSYPANGANEGDACTVNGSPGSLRAIPGHDGWLQCVADTNNDTRRDSQQTMDAAYSEYEWRIQNAWRSQS
jgi:hypothetical protein